MINFYHGFDGLDIAFQGAFPEYVLEQLKTAKSEAQAQKQEITCRLGKSDTPVKVAETGAKGGYNYRFDTGIDGMIFFIAHSIDSKRWNIRISVHSLCLALHGYNGTKEKIIFFLKEWEATGPATRDRETGKTVSFPLESVGRIDYCFDFWTDSNFIISPECISAHSRSIRKFNGKDYSCGAKGKEIESVTIGRMPNRQATIYNKTKEIKASSKPYWNDIWKDHIGDKLNGRNFKGGTVWRVEVRAGKAELDQWNLRRFDDLESMAGDIIKGILGSIRYVTPNHDKNPARWPIAKFWQDCIDTTDLNLASFISGAVRKKIVRDFRDNIIKGYNDRTMGNLIGLCAAKGLDIEDLPEILDTLKDRITGLTLFEKQAFEEKYKRVNERLLMVE